MSLLGRYTKLSRNLWINNHNKYFYSTQQTNKKPSILRVRISSFLMGFSVTGAVGAYFFYYNFNDTADQIKESIFELGSKYKKDTKLLNEKIINLQQRMDKIENK